MTEELKFLELCCSAAYILQELTRQRLAIAADSLTADERSWQRKTEVSCTLHQTLSLLVMIMIVEVTDGNGPSVILK